MLTGIRLFFRKPSWYVGKKVIYSKSPAWFDAAQIAYGWHTTCGYAVREGWVGKITECSENRFTIHYENGTIQSYSLDAILDSDLNYIHRFDRVPWA